MNRVGKNVSIIAGGKRAPLKFLVSLIRTMAYSPYLDRVNGSTHLLSAGLYASKIFLALLAYDQRDKRTLFDLIRLFHSSIATDPRDKIYSLLGIAEPYSQTRLIVDYTRRWQDVFTDTVKYIIQGSHRLDVVALAGSASRSSDLPSWVPNFASHAISKYSDGEPGIPDPLSFGANSRNCAGGNQVAATRFTNTGRYLETEVIMVGRILHTLPTEHFGARLGPIEEIGRRMDFVAADYMRNVSRPSEIVKRMLPAFIRRMLYSATFDCGLPHPLNDSGRQEDI